MQTINLYKYQRVDGGTTISPVKPNCEYIHMYRLVADEGKELTKDGVSTTTCTDTDTTDGWYEVEVNEDGEVIDTDEATEADYQSAIEELGVNFNE
jgi:hypothetical protein